MATVQSRSGPPIRPTDASRSRRRAAATMEPREEAFSSVSRIPRRDLDPFQSHSAQALSAQAKATRTKLPQTSTRQPSLPSPTGRPALTQQSQSWGSSNSGGSGRPGSHIPTPSGSSSSGKSLEGTAKDGRNVLRRKRSTLTQDTSSLRNDSRAESRRTSSSSSIPRSRGSFEPRTSLQFDGTPPESASEIRVTRAVEAAASTVNIVPELDRYRDIKRPVVSSEGSHYDNLYRLATQDLPPPTPILFSGTSSQLSAFSGSPSTRFSGSPGPGPYSRDTTPTSMSSQSPGLVAPIRIQPARGRGGSPAHTRPPVTRRRAGSVPNEGEALSADVQGLAAVRESLTSSSSNSTVRDGDKKEPRKARRLSPPPPSPPPRKSSQKFRRPNRDDEASPSKASREPARPVMTSPSPPATSPPNVRLNPAAASSSSTIGSVGTRSPPARPSRDGTPDLQSQLFGPMPVVHSNLSSTSLSYERRGSEPFAAGPLPRSTTPSSLPDRYQQPSRLPMAGREPTPAPHHAVVGVVVPPDPRKPTKTESGRTTRTPSPSTSTFNHRFPFFGRRKTAPDNVPQAEKKDKSTRKGPAAGTGHEGYGRVGAVRRRSGSGSGSASNTTARVIGSQESLQSEPPYDSFLAERQNPIIIAGGGEVVENRNFLGGELARTDSNQSLFLGRPSLDSKVSSDMSTTSRDGARTTLWPSAFPRDVGARHPLSSRRPSDSASEAEAPVMKSNLAFRRSAQRLGTSPDPTGLRLPRPLNAAGVSSPSVNSFDTSFLSDDSAVESTQDASRGRETSVPAKKLTKRVRSPRKWNLFSRSHSQPATAKKKGNAAVPVTATVTAAPHKPVAFYMMDSSEQEDSPLDVQEVLREAEVFDSPRLPVPAFTERRPSTGSQSAVSEQLDLRPLQLAQMSNQARAAPLPQVQPHHPLRVAQPAMGVPAHVTTSSGRPSRLPQVGRIPKVVSSRPEAVSPKSFSRPFSHISVHTPPRVRDLVDDESIAKGPSPPKLSTPDLTQEESTVTSGNDSSRQSLLIPPRLDAARGEREFLAFSPPRKDSTYTTSSSSTGASKLFPYSDTTAIIPEKNGPLVEDEIWDEYNDLLGDDTMKPLPSATSSRGVPFPLESYQTTLANIDKPLESPAINNDLNRPKRDTAQHARAARASSVYSADMTERIGAIFSQKPEPERDFGTPSSVTELVPDYMARGSPAVPAVAPAPGSQRSSTSSSKSRRSATSSKSSEDESPLSQVNLRVGSMTVSKWLTFGHVLFSPAREELLPVVGSLKRHSILVVDGLGNDDWSFYAAETYPAATFFNLSPRAPLPEDHKSSTGFPLSPPNHHQIQYLSHLEKFPFGPESFTSVVYRFPAVVPESHYRNIVSEARRVLKPGGYLELSILDVDLNNMGNRGRRAIRRLKERIHAQSGDISLASSADFILRLLGKTGFSDIKTCRVGVPVASALSARPMNTSSPSKGTSELGVMASKQKVKDERSLAEMMNDDSEVADESITKMVAKVGRWWYSRCYESAAGAGPGKTNSIWNDKALLAECEEWGTSLKLMVCYAKVPDGRARVASI